MTSKLEEVARAICWADGENPDEVYGQHSTAEGRPFWVDRINAARAALEATKNPTMGMCEAFYRFTCNTAEPDPNDFTPQITKAVNAMIDAALEER